MNPLPDHPRPASSGPAAHLSRTTPVVPPIYQSTTFVLDDQSYHDIIENEGLGETWYSRFGNPTVQAAADGIARLEDAQAGLMTSSGMGAIATTILSLCKAGDRVVSARELYGDTRDLLVRDLPQWGIDVDFVTSTDLYQWRNALAKGPVALAYAETISNPQLRLLDIPAVAALAHDAGARFVVDNTFASPFTIQPLRHGADLVVNSVTKFLNGHSDVIAGCIAADDDTILRDAHRRIVTLGTSLDPHPAFLVSRALHTFELRLERQSRSASHIARRLSELPGVQHVRHLSLPDHPDFSTAERLLPPDRRSAMVTVVVEGGNERAGRVMKAFGHIIEATSLGGVETLASAPYNSSHFSLTQDEARLAGIEPGMIRLSIGVEDPELLVADFEQALEQTAA